MMNDTKRLKVEFKNWLGDYANVADIGLNIYDGDRTIVLAAESTDIVHYDTGKYYYDYELPDGEIVSPMAYEFYGTLDGSQILKREYIERAWAEYQLKSELLRWVKDYCNNTFVNDDGVEVIPGGVEVFLTQASIFIEKQTGKTSESLGDYSVAWSTDYPQSMMRLLSPYRRATFV